MSAGDLDTLYSRVLMTLQESKQVKNDIEHGFEEESLDCSWHSIMN